MKYYIPFAYQKYGRVFVEANNIKQAKEKAINKLKSMSVLSLDFLSEYLEDSLELDEDGLIFDENKNIVEED